MTPRVAALFVHPLKSAAAIAVSALALDDRGAVADRRWLVIDDDGMQITARETPALARVRPSFGDVHGERIAARNVDGPLWLDAPGLSRLRLSIPTTSATRSVQVWKDRLDAHDMGDEVAGWMSEALARPCRVVRLAEHAHRPLALKYAGPLPHVGRRVAFSDGAPLLILGQASVDALNARLVEQGGDTVSASRFRPNVLLENTTAHEEDTWSRVRLGEVVIGVGSPCERCVMTTIDPLTGEQGIEPLRMLSTYRRQDGPVLFGMNATHEQPGTIYVGDAIRLQS